MNRIAAGEIIVAPVNALKEMLENCVDAGATSIEVVAKDGGLKLLQVTDNGSGINKADLGILCERFTTSKLSKFEDLSAIATYGFRGEALASISHISHLTVTTKKKEYQCAWKVNYLDGVPSAAPAAVAGRDGTQISVADLFYNVPSRLRVFKSPAEEYGKILDVVGRYACHCENVAFSCKKFGDSFPSLMVQAASSPIDRIRSVYGSAIAAELIEVTVPKNDKYGFQGAKGLVTNPNYCAKRATPPVLFINHRSVASDPLRKGITGIYATHLPRGGHSFVYLALDIDPRNLDVNVHPTKREVRFLYEDEIVEHICEAIQQALADCSASRTFQTQTILPGARSATLLKDNSPSTPQKRPYEYNLIRTDSKQVKLTSIFGTPTTAKSTQSDVHVTLVESPCRHDHDVDESMTPADDDDTTRVAPTQPKHVPTASQFQRLPDRDRVDVRLKSVLQLRAAIQTAAHEPLTAVFADHTYIGVVDFDRRLAAFQQGVRMFVVDYGVLSQELFYQACLADFGNFGTLTLEAETEAEEEEGLSVLELLTAGGFETDIDVPAFLGQLWSMHQMFSEYFSITLKQSAGAAATATPPTDLRLTTLPMLVKGYIPPFAKLPLFLYALATQVDWAAEQACLDSISRALAKFYTPESLPIPDAQHDEELKDRQQEVAESLERLVFPAVKQRLLAPKWVAEHVVEIANLPGLYKVFERC